MAKTAPQTFTSHTTRTRGGVGFYSDDRDNNRLEEMGCAIPDETAPLPGELRKYSKKLGKGQSWDFFAVRGTCAHCRGGEPTEAEPYAEGLPLNIIGLCPDCARLQAKDTFTQEQYKEMVLEMQDEMAVMRLMLQTY